MEAKRKKRNAENCNAKSETIKIKRNAQSEFWKAKRKKTNAQF